MASSFLNLGTGTTRPAIKPPARFRVLVSFKSDTGGWYQGLVGNAHSLDEAKKLIEEDKRAMRETYGGLIAPTPTKGREYYIFENPGWKQVK